MPNSVSPPLMLFRVDRTRIHWRASWHHSHRDSRVPLYNTTKLLTWAVVVTVANILSLCCCSHYCHVVGTAYFFAFVATVIWAFFDDNKKCLSAIQSRWRTRITNFLFNPNTQQGNPILESECFLHELLWPPLFSVWPYVPKRFGL